VDAAATAAAGDAFIVSFFVSNDPNAVIPSTHHYQNF
jgi:hypothetical protein